MAIEGAGFTGGMRALFRSLAIPASGLSAQRQRIDAIARNIANAGTTRTAEGGAYQRQVVRLESGMVAGPVVVRAGEVTLPEPGVQSAEGVRVAAIEVDSTEGPLVYEPGHPDADESGYVRYPNVRITDELVDLMDARRVYEANATVFQAVKAMLRRATEI